MFSNIHKPFWNLFCSPRLPLFDKKHSKNSNTVNNFSISIFSVTWSFRNHCNADLALKKISYHQWLI